MKSVLKYLAAISSVLCALLAPANKATGQNVSQAPVGDSPAIVKQEGGKSEGPGTKVEVVNNNSSLYRIGPGDILSISVLKHPELSRDAVKVDNDGSIPMPRVDGDIKAACKTQRELAEEIKRRLDFLRNPYVEVSIKEYNSQPVAVIGAVSNPGRFQLQRQVRLLELLTFVNGPSNNAGQYINVIRERDSLRCAATNEAQDTSPVGLLAYRLEDTLHAVEDANPILVPGDIIRIPEAEQAYLVGNVKNPQAIPLKAPVMLSQAIAMGGGALPNSNLEKVKITRQLNGAAGRTELLFNLKAINRHQQEDVALQANDIIEVPGSSGGKAVLQGFARLFVPTLTTLPLRVIP